MIIYVIYIFIIVKTVEWGVEFFECQANHTLFREAMKLKEL